VTIRHATLAAGAVLVLALTGYLFVQVRSKPASAEAPPTVAQRPAAPAVDEETDPTPSTPPREARPAPPPPRAPSDTPVPPPPPTPELPGKPSLGDFVRQAPDNKATGFIDPKVMAVMDEANKAYDRGDLDEARAIAQKALAQQPGNARMLRILVSAACISGDSADAQKAYLQLPPPDREQMKVRCARYGMTFKDE